MNDERKTKAQLNAELKAVRQRVIELESAETDRQQLDAALRASETRYRRLFETAQDGILLLDAATGQIIDVNPFLVKLLGYTHTEFIGKRLWEIGPFKDVAESKLAFEQLQNNEYIRYEDLPLQTKDGQHINVEFVNNVYRVNGDRVIQCNVRDITAHKRGQDALRRSEAELKEAQHVGRLGSWAWDATTDTITWPEEYYRIYGFDPNQRLPGYEEHLKVYSPESAARLDAAAKKSIETGVPYEIDLEQIRPDGTRRWVTARGEVKRDANGQIVGLRGTAQDITRRKRTEEQLRESEFFFKESQRAASIGSYKTDFINGFWESSTVLDQIFGIDKSYSRSVQGWLDIIHPDDREMMDRYLREEVISKRKPFNKEYRIIRKSDGEIRWVIGLGEVDFDAEGNIISMIGTIQDITERKRAEEEIRKLNAELEERVIQRTAQLEATNRELEAFSYSVSHDLRAPLRTMDGFSRILLEEYGPQLEAEAQRYLQIVRANAQQMGHLIDTLLAVSCLGRQPLNKQTVDMNQLARQALDEVRRDQPDRSLELVSGDLPPCQADPALLKQVWINLLSNAFKFTYKRDQARIEIGCQLDQG